MSARLFKTKSKSLSKKNLSQKSNSIKSISKKSKKSLDKEYIEHCIKLSHDKKYMKSGEKEKNIMLKRCKICKDFKNEKCILYCIYCQDAYHSYCVKSKLKNFPKNRECIICPR